MRITCTYRTFLFLKEIKKPVGISQENWNIKHAVMVLITQVVVDISVYQYTVRRASQTFQRVSVDPEENLDFQHHYKIRSNSKTFYNGMMVAQSL